ncbi:phenylalanine--tRNA ligase beta subunit [Anaeramoeba ignava]|uniref:Phenylalanine--tRNA ligase beta subunit n=1 Tax=Anaeramoeba ignava TaxID=1746090 RepID=A0A9Q0LLS8_ANAIG|nr:phenylalanine--tRNA ligase beta subunit [Anaeramoeba ignava]
MDTTISFQQPQNQTLSQLNNLLIILLNSLELVSMWISIEVLNFALSSHQDCFFENMRMEDDEKQLCVIQNPKTTDFQVFFQKPQTKQFS